MAGGAPIGNQNAVKGKRWRDAIDRALEKVSKAEGIQALDEIALTVVKIAKAGPTYETGDKWLDAVKELGDRIDGKVAQQLALTGSEDEPLVTKIIHESR